MVDWKRPNRRTEMVIAGCLIVFSFCLLGAVNSHGTEIVLGYAPLPKPCYANQVVYETSSPVAQLYPGQVPAPPPGMTPPPPPAPSAPGSALPPTPGTQAKCREWRMIERRMDYRLDPYTGKPQEVPIEKWDWVEVPCSSPAPGAQVEVGGPPSEYLFPHPPQVAVIPGTYVYVVPDVDVEILFYRGHWYRPYAGRWYSAVSYNGPWVYLDPARVPRVLLTLPPNYRRVPPRYRRIPYEHLQREWEKWERERYWHRDREWREGWRR